ncbi:hypothetical protein DLM85_13550 [Hymenobacter edaphi]|uniref:DUF3857 domain-containing protein n=1 Tax=Hymenobacter edaphi TaxID=2211146 RepID=A0A328BF99_9BACT|nr:hypothetical protein DLM85_13550 [Hymenobacter edaphi]
MLTLLLVLGWGALAQGQPDPVKFGQVTAADFDASALKGAAGAPAVVLCDYGVTRIEGAHDGFRVAFERVTRVLIQTKAGYSQAEVQVPLYRFEGQEDELLNLRGATYNLVNGRVEKQKMAGSAVFREQTGPDQMSRKFTLPGVREGSIVEYAYTVKSWRLFKLHPWQFQHPDVPVAWSEYRTIVPGFYVYKEMPRGYLPYALRTQAVVPYSTIYHVSHQDDRGNTADVAPTQRLVTDAISSRWVMRDVPAFRPEAYMTTPRDYLAALEFELHQTAFDPARPKAVTSTWEKITDELLKEEAFGGLLERRDLAGEFSNASPLTPAATALRTSHPDPTARAAAALALVRGALRYDGEEWLYARTPQLRQLVDKQLGNAAEVNLLLVHTLRDAGLAANPVLLSTRGHGRVQQEIPVLSQFNYVVAHVALPAGQDLLLDATDPLAPAGTLPERCLNGYGRLIAPAGRWLPLTPAQRYSCFTNARLTLTPQGEVQGSVRVEYGGYAGLSARARLAAQGEQKFLAEWQQQRPDWQLTRRAVQRAADPAAPLLLDVDLRLPGAGAAQPLYLPLMRLLATNDNPFQPETRLYPVDLGMPHEYATTVLLTLPAGYRPEALPGRLLLELPGGAGRFAFDTSLQGQVLQLTSRLQLTRARYAPGEYAALRELVTRAVAKHQEPLVLRRTP